MYAHAVDRDSYCISMYCSLCLILNEKATAYAKCPECNASFVCRECCMDSNSCLNNCHTFIAPRDDIHNSTTFVCTCPSEFHEIDCQLNQTLRNSLVLVNIEDGLKRRIVTVNMKILCGPSGDMTEHKKKIVVDWFEIPDTSKNKKKHRLESMSRVFHRLVRRCLECVEVLYKEYGAIRTKILIKGKKKIDQKNFDNQIWKGNFMNFNVKNFSEMFLNSRNNRKVCDLVIFTMGTESEILDGRPQNDDSQFSKNRILTMESGHVKNVEIRVCLRHVRSDGSKFFWTLHNRRNDDNKTFCIRKCEDKREHETYKYEQCVSILSEILFVLSFRETKGEHHLYVWKNWEQRKRLTAENISDIFENIFDHHSFIMIDAVQVNEKEPYAYTKCFPPSLNEHVSIQDISSEVNEMLNQDLTTFYQGGEVYDMLNLVRAAFDGSDSDE